MPIYLVPMSNPQDAWLTTIIHLTICQWLSTQDTNYSRYSNDDYQQSYANNNYLR